MFVQLAAVDGWSLWNFRTTIMVMLMGPSFPEFQNVRYVVDRLVLIFPHTPIFKIKALI
jgi:hypothetical protein